MTKMRAKRYGNGNTPFRMTREINGRTYDVRMDNADIKSALGCNPRAHWPDQGVPPTRVLGWTIKVLPKADTKGQGRRCVAFHPACKRWICVGHIGQHLEACKH
jgi:hypothetical protein